MKLKEVETNLAQDGEILRAIAAAEPCIILSEGDIERPVKGIFKAPVGADRLK